MHSAETVFDGRVQRAHIVPCQTAGWPLFPAMAREESPGSTQARCRVTPGGGDPRESATETHRRARQLSLRAWDGMGGKGEMVR